MRDEDPASSMPSATQPSGASVPGDDGVRRAARRQPASAPPESAAGPSALVLRALGALCLCDATGAVISARRKELALLAFVARAGRPVSRAELTALFWGEHPEPRARHSLRQALLQLRRAAPGALHVTPEQVVLVPGRLTLDVDRFEEHTAAGRAADAIDLWAGEFLADAEDAGGPTSRFWVEGERVRLRRRLAAAFGQRVDALEREGRFADAVATAGRWAAALPFETDAQVRLVLGLLLAGRPAEALTSHEAFVRRLAHELDASPDPVLDRLGAVLERAVRRAVRHGLAEPAVTRREGPGAGDAAGFAGLAAAWQSVRAGEPAVARVAPAGPADLLRLDAFLDAVAAGPDAVRVVRAALDGGVPARSLADAVAVVLAAPAGRPVMLCLEGDADGGALLAALTPGRETPLLVLVRAGAPVAVVGAGVEGEDAPGSADAGPAVHADAPADHPAARGRGPRHAWIAAAAVALVCVVGAAALALVARPAWPWLRGEAVTLAVGGIVAFGGAADDARAVEDLLATNLARVRGLRVVSGGRIEQLRRQLGGGGAVDAARAAGATEVVEGALHRHPDLGLRLDLRRTDLRTGAVVAAYTAHGADLFALVDEATAAVGGRLAGPDRPRVADVTTHSESALRAYVAGLEAYYRGDAREAAGRFDAALRADSTFAMAAWYLALSLEDMGQAGINRALARAGRLAERATDRERLVIRSAWAIEMEEPAGLAVAETLAIRYPAEPAGHLFLGRARLWRGEYGAALRHLEHALRLDSLSLTRPAGRCHACDALADIVRARMYADSFAAAERTARDWVRRQPGSARAWGALASVLEYQDRHAEAAEARRRAAGPGSGHRMTGIWPAVLSLRAGDFADADVRLRAQAADADAAVRGEAIWYLAISLRGQGRLREALEVARRLRNPDDAPPDAPARLPMHRTLEAQILFEMGRHDAAAALFDSLAAGFADLPAVRRPVRDRRAWLLAHVATARAAAGDTAAVAALAREIERLGRSSALARDQRLHHHVRGLLLAARGDDAGAAAAFRAALFAGAGYTRTNVELAMALLRLGRPHEAVPALEPALRGPLDGSALYLSRTELHALLARAHAAAGNAAGAAVHARHALHAWRHADPQFDGRRDSLRTLLDRLDARLAGR